MPDTRSTPLQATPLLLALALAACGDDTSNGGGTGGADTTSSQSDASSSTAPTTASQSSGGGGEDAGAGGAPSGAGGAGGDGAGGEGTGGSEPSECPAFEPGTLMLSTDWGLEEENGLFSAFAQAVGDGRIASHALLAETTRACFEIASIIGGSPVDPGYTPTTEEATATCNDAIETFTAWRGGRTLVIEIQPPDCTIAATNPECVALCDDDDLCLSHCTASAEANQTCTEAYANIIVDAGQDEDPALLAELSDAFEHVMDTAARSDLLASSVERTTELPAVLPPLCATTLADAISASVAATQTGAELAVSVIGVFGGG